MATLCHVTLDLPRELHLVADVQVDLEVAEVCHPVIVEGVQALDHQDLQTVVESGPQQDSLRFISEGTILGDWQQHNEKSWSNTGADELPPYCLEI